MFPLVTNQPRTCANTGLPQLQAAALSPSSSHPYAVVASRTGTSIRDATTTPRLRIPEPPRLSRPRRSPPSTAGSAPRNDRSSPTPSDLSTSPICTSPFPPATGRASACRGTPCHGRATNWATGTTSRSSIPGTRRSSCAGTAQTWTSARRSRLRAACGRAGVWNGNGRCMSATARRRSRRLRPWRGRVSAGAKQGRQWCS